MGLLLLYLINCYIVFILNHLILCFHFPCELFFASSSPSECAVLFPIHYIFKFSFHCWFQLAWFRCQKPYLVRFASLMVIPWLNIHPIIRNILEIIPCGVETDVYSSVHFEWNVPHICVWSTGLCCHLSFLFPLWSYRLLELFEYLSWIFILEL